MYVSLYKRKQNQKEKKSNIGRQETTIKHEGKYIYTNISNIVIIIIYFCVSLHIIYTYIYIFSVNINIAYTSLSLSLFSTTSTSLHLKGQHRRY